MTPARSPSACSPTPGWWTISTGIAEGFGGRGGHGRRRVLRRRGRRDPQAAPRGHRSRAGGPLRARGARLPARPSASRPRSAPVAIWSAPSRLWREAREPRGGVAERAPRRSPCPRPGRRGGESRRPGSPSATPSATARARVRTAIQRAKLEAELAAERRHAEGAERATREAAARPRGARAADLPRAARPCRRWVGRARRCAAWPSARAACGEARRSGGGRGEMSQRSFASAPRRSSGSRPSCGTRARR